MTMELEIIEMERGTMMMERMTITMMMEKMTITMMMERMTMMMEKMTMMMERMTMAPGDCRNVGKGSSTLMRVPHSSTVLMISTSHSLCTWICGEKLKKIRSRNVSHPGRRRRRTKLLLVRAMER